MSATAVLGGCDLWEKYDAKTKAAIKVRLKEVDEVVAKGLAEQAARNAEMDKEYQRYIEQCQREEQTDGKVE
ncbi:MAG: hypothetical protein EU981_04520 [Candidatus Liberibacter ctenarytainae]|uniref:Uncharacterized protein n=1 Tax=Candidatus Liberibacter ctenarytainae TaxID=2020335 RepID=A0A937AD53_9HYPH|nr:hypothetical protein [Candidatus Liberibacter ctenarytainae]